MEIDEATQAFLKEAHKQLSEFTSARVALEKNFEEKRAEIDGHILKWKRAIDGVLAVTESEQGDPEDVEVSAFVAGRKTVKFTDGVRLCLKQRSNTVLSAPDVRDGLINLGFDFGKYAQPLVPIHNCLKRLVEQGEAEAVKTAEGQSIGYKWISPIERALAEEVSGYGDVSGLYLSEVKRMTEEAKRAAEGTVYRFIEDADAARRAIDEQVQATAKAEIDFIHQPKRSKKD